MYNELLLQDTINKRLKQFKANKNLRLFIL
jgi:hypothetical protein